MFQLNSKIALMAALRTVLLTLPIWILPVIGTASSTTFKSDFESGFSGWEKELCCEHSAQIVRSPTRAGRYAAKFTFYRTDPKRRAELKLNPVPANSEWTYRVSTFLPVDYENDPSYEIITQWHEIPDRHLGETWRRPPLNLSIRNGQFTMSNRWDSKPVTVSSKEGGTQKWNLGPITKGQWIDWVFHVKWSHKADGLLKVYKNGRLVVSKTGPNTYNDKVGPYFKIGIYKPQWKVNPRKSTTTQRVIYFDQVRVERGYRTFRKPECDIGHGRSLQRHSKT